VVVGACGASFDKTFTTALTGGENRQTGPAARLFGFLSRIL